METKNLSTLIFAVKTTVGQEKNAAGMIEVKAKMNKLDVLSILVPEILRGFIFIEVKSPHVIEEAIAGVKHVKSKITGKVQLSEIEKYLESKPIIDALDVGYVVEVTGGPFKGMRALVTKINKVRNEATLELLEATFTLPITVNADYLKLIEKTKTEEKKG
ncbi:MAG: transcription elongation factor Spt5 [Candidatus Bathyarchaeota archaeon]